MSGSGMATPSVPGLVAKTLGAGPVLGAGDEPSVVEPIEPDRVRVEFHAPQRGVAPGQSAVFYRGEELLGGGRIVESFR